MSTEFKPLVSIIIPIYNGSNYMREAIDSALAQTYSNIEILVINDGSSDNTEDVAKSYNGKIRYFSKENGGVSSALNVGIANMQGEYFSWLSHDDFYAPDKIERNIVALKDEPIRIAYSDYDSIDEKGRYLGTISAKKLHRSANYEFGIFPIICGLVHGCSLLIHRSHFERVGVFDENLKTTQDYDLWFKMFRGQRLVYIPEPLIKGRIHKKQTGLNSDKTILEGEILWTNMLKSLTDEEMCVIGGSEWHFWINQAQFMEKNTQYAKSTEYAFERLRKSKDVLKDSLVSIIIPFYNRIHLLLECIKSVQQQSYKNWELILINDGSTNDIDEIEHYIMSDERIKIINSAHMGVAHARNIGLDAAVGKFIAFLDSDDKWNSVKLEKQLKFMLDNNYCVSHTNYNRVNINNGDLLAKIDLSELQGDVFKHFIYSCGVATPCIVVERELWGSLRFPKSMDYGEDVCCWLELAWHSRWGLLKEALTLVSVGESSAYKDNYKQQLGYIEILRYVLKNREWAKYQLEIGIIARDFADLYPKTNFANRYNISLRLYRAVRRYGVTRTFKILLHRIKFKILGQKQ